MKRRGMGQVSLTEGPITKNILLFSIPLLLSNLFQQLYNSVDSAVVGTFSGDLALAAVGGSTGSIINLLIGFFLGISTGTGILYAMHYGAGDYKGLKKLISSALFLGTAAGIVIGVLGAVFSKQMLIWMKTPEDILPLATIYLRIILGGMVITMIYNISAGMIRAEGDSTRPLIYLIIGGVVNLILDILFVAVFNWGVVGAAAATLAAQATAAILTVFRLTRLPEEYRLNFKNFKINGLAIWDITRISIPCGLQGSMFNISNLLVQAKINTFGTIAVAGITAYKTVNSLWEQPDGAAVTVPGLERKGVIKTHGEILGWAKEIIGRCLTVSFGNVDAIFTEKRSGFIEKGNFDKANVDLLDYEIVVVKLGYLFEELKPYADRELFALTDGASCVELSRLNLKNIVRPMYPLEDFAWRAE